MSTQSSTLAQGTTSWGKPLILALVLAVFAFATSPKGPLGAFWAPSPDMPAPTGIELPLFILLNVAEVLTFGLGVSFLMFGYSAVRKNFPASRGLTFAAHFSIAWLLISWWPHDSLHVHNGMNLGGLLVIEYAFHITLMIAGAILAYYFLTVLRNDKRLTA